jgi:hypothetical protein
LKRNIGPHIQPNLLQNKYFLEIENPLRTSLRWVGGASESQSDKQSDQTELNTPVSPAAKDEPESYLQINWHFSNAVLVLTYLRNKNFILNTFDD